MKHLLVITDLFPRHDEDFRGIFVRDWVKSVLPHFKVTVLNINFMGPQLGLRESDEKGYKLIQYNLATHQKSKWGRSMDHLLYFSTGKKLISGMVEAFDMVHAHGSVFAGKLALKHANGKPVVITEHAGPVEKFLSRSRVRKAAKRNMEKAGACLFVSSYSRDAFMAHGILNPHSFVVGNPINEKVFNITGGERTKQFVFVGRLDPFKGGLKVVIAFKKLGLHIQGWKLMIVGSGKEEAAIQKERTEGVERIPFLPPESLVPLYNMSSALLFPSHHETFGLVAAEAIACGCPVIGPNVTGPVDYLNETNSIQIDPFSDVELEKAMMKMVNNEVNWDREGMSKEIIHRFGAESFGNQLKNIYESLM